MISSWILSKYMLVLVGWESFPLRIRWTTRLSTPSFLRKILRTLRIQWTIFFNRLAKFGHEVPVSRVSLFELLWSLRGNTFLYFLIRSPMLELPFLSFGSVFLARLETLIWSIMDYSWNPAPWSEIAHGFLRDFQVQIKDFSRELMSNHWWCVHFLFSDSNSLYHSNVHSNFYFFLKNIYKGVLLLGWCAQLNNCFTFVGIGLYPPLCNVEP